MAFNLRDIVQTVAPSVAAILGGPLAGTAVRALSELLLGTPDGDETAVAQALQSASPDTLLRLKDLEQQFAIQMQQLGIDVERLHAEDRQSARQREAQVQDWVPRVMALLMFLGFFGVLGALIFIEIPVRGEAPLNIMLGVLGGGITSVLSYYYGSSSGSAQKTRMLGEQIRGNGGP